MSGRSKTGKREDLGGLYVRSGWEANYARYLNFLQKHGEIVSWEYEPETFSFDHIKRGTRFYTPDFKVTFPDGRVEWHEVKGYMTQRGRTAIDRFRRFYPDETLVLIDQKAYRALKRQLAGLIPHWE